MATQGRKPGATPRPPNLPDPTWPFSDSTAPGSLSSVPGSPSVSSVSAGILTSRASADQGQRSSGWWAGGGIGKKKKQKNKALLCPYFPKHSRLLIPPNSSPAPLLSSAFILQTSVPAGQVVAWGLEGGPASSQGSRAGCASQLGVWGVVRNELPGG